MADDKPQYSKPNSQLDLERRLENGNASDRLLSTAPGEKPSADDAAGRSYAVEGNDLTGYVGVDPIYQTYANDTEGPYEADDSAEKQILEEFAEGQAELAGVKSDDEVTSASGDGETASAKESSPTTTKAAPKKSTGGNDS